VPCYSECTLRTRTRGAADGHWIQLERYIQAHSGAEFTHGLCPECDGTYRGEHHLEKQPKE
jgi:hypothetical protein